jgi:outer membrane protein assembly factor BamB
VGGVKVRSLKLTRRPAALLAAFCCGAATLVLPAASPALAGQGVQRSVTVDYAYAGGKAVSPRTCPRTTQAGQQCSLSDALRLVRPGGSVLLVTSGKSGTYYGNFAVRTAHTTASLPVTIKPATGVRTPLINGDASGKVRCPTGACGGAVLTVAAGVFAIVQWVKITGGVNKGAQGGGGVDDLGTATLAGVTISDCSAPVGGGAAVGNGARLTVTGSVFTGDKATYFGGAIDSGSAIGGVSDSGTLTISGSTFTGDQAARGGAINTGDGGKGTATIGRSVFKYDTASAHGGAIDNGDSGSGSLTVSDSTFSGDKAEYGGAIDNADSAGKASLTVLSSTFAADSAVHGGAIDNGERGTGTVTVRTSTFTADKATRQGAVIDTGDAGGAGSVVITSSTIDGNSGSADIVRLAGTVDVAGSILAGTSANCTHKITDDGYNLVSNANSGCGFSTSNSDLIGVNPGLSKLAGNGGPTQTMEPWSTSPVLEQIPDPGVATLGSGKVIQLCPVPDQRGARNTEAVGCAIGSVDPATNIPVVTSLGSSQGPAAGGGTVVIRGGNFAAKASVWFGAVRSAHVTVVSATEIKAAIPALPTSDSSRTVSVTARNPTGRVSPPRAAAIYTYYTPDWSSYLGGASHSSYNPAATSVSVAAVANLQPVWQFHPQPELPNSTAAGLTTDDASPVVYRGVIYVGLEDGYFEAISEKTGQPIWSTASLPFLGVEPATTCGGGGLGVISTATVATDPQTGDPVVYVNAPDGYLWALNAVTGATLWKAVVGIPAALTGGPDNYYAWGSPTVANGKVYIGIASNCDVPLVKAGVLSFNQATGKQIAYWDSLPPGLTGASVWSSVAVLPDGNVVATTGNAVGNNNIPDSESINILDGTTLKLLGTWQAPQTQASGDSDFGGSPTVFTAYPNGVATTMVGACNKDGVYYALRAGDMSAGPLWTHRMGVPTTGALANECDAAAIWNGKYLIEGGGSQVTIDGTQFQGSVQALNPTTGKPIWQTGLTGWIVGSPSEDGAGVVAAPVLYSTFGATGVYGVYLLSASTGRILKFISTEPRGVFAQPVWDGKYLLVGDEASPLPLTAYAVTTNSGSVSVSPGSVSANTTVTLTLTATGGAGFNAASPPNVIVSSTQVVVESVSVTSSTTLSVQVKVLGDAVSGGALDVTATNPDLTAYSCTGCLAVG